MCDVQGVCSSSGYVAHTCIPTACWDAAVPVVDGVDAGIDSFDARPDDAAYPDASVDDANVLDASVADANAPDASAADASAPDASVTDASGPDASAPDGSVADTRSGNIIVSNLTNTNNGQAVPLVHAEYLDLATQTVQPTVGSDGVGECTVYTYEVGASAPPTMVNEAPIEISGSGLTPSSASCLFSGAGYSCAASTITDFTKEITISKLAGTVVPDVQSGLTPSGDGLALSSSSALPHQISLASPAVDLTFACDGDGDCGNSGALLTVWYLRGRTTDGSLTTGCAGGVCGPSDMPEPVTSWAEFNCKGTPGATTLTFTAAALDALSVTSPTRVETTVLRTSVVQDGVTWLFAGNGFIGYTTP